MKRLTLLRRHRASLVVACVLGLVLGGMEVTELVLLRPGQPLVGTRVGESPVPAEGLDAWLARLDEELAKRPMSLESGDGAMQFTFGDLGIRADSTKVRAALVDQAERGPWIDRVLRAVRARRGEEAVEPRFSFDREVARALLTMLAPGLRRDPRDALVDLGQHRKMPSEPGRELDVEATLSRLADASRDAGTSVPLAFRPIAAEVTVSSLTDVDVSQVLSSFETDFAGHAGRRAVNIARAAAYLDGAIIEPGATFSFNRVVGERTLARGFVDAPVIVEDEMEAGVGGGVCQVATTLHAAAVYGNFDVIRRRSHSRPSGYAPLGLDATVIDHEVDLRLRNPYDVPILVHAFLPTKTTIRVELLGRKPEVKVKHDYVVTERFDFERRVKYKAEVERPVRKQRGHYGYEVTSVVRITSPDGTSQRRTYPSRYYPVPEVYWVPAGFDISELPELPEGATDTVVSDPTTPSATQDTPHGLAEPPS